MPRWPDGAVDSAPEPGPKPAGLDPIDAAWARLLERWDEEEAHEAFLALCAASGRLAEAGRRYRSVREGSDPKRAEEAARRIERLLVLAASSLRADRTDAETARRRAHLLLTLLAATIFSVLVGTALLSAAR